MQSAIQTIIGSDLKDFKLFAESSGANAKEKKNNANCIPTNDEAKSSITR